MSYTWFRVDSSLVDHPKVAELEVKLQNPLAGWYVVRLWSWTQRYAPTGVITKARIAQAEAACRWPGRPGELIEVLVEVGLLDVQKRDVEVHDWSENQGKLVEKSRRDSEAKREKRRKQKEEAERAARAGRAPGAPTDETDGRDGRTDEKLLETPVNQPPADFGSGEPEASRFDVEHWRDDVEQLVAWMVCTRDLSARFKPSTDDEVARTREWAVSWFLKYEPDQRAVDRMHRAFEAFLESPWARAPERDARLQLWCSDDVWQPRWDAERAADQPRRAS